jgi:hypothetical protein
MEQIGEGMALVETQGVIVRGVPTSRCPGCGPEYHDALLGAILEELGRYLPAGEIRFEDLPPRLVARRSS